MLAEYADLQQLVRVEKSCPYEDLTRRNHIRTLLKQVEELHGQGPINMFRSMDKILEEYLPRSS
jgi:tRNA(Ile)-lysidine synthase TilS/MesJ